MLNFTKVKKNDFFFFKLCDRLLQGRGGLIYPRWLGKALLEEGRQITERRRDRLGRLGCTTIVGKMGRDFGS